MKGKADLMLIGDYWSKEAEMKKKTIVMPFELKTGKKNIFY